MTPHSGAMLSFQPRIRKGAFFEAAWRHGCRNFSVYNRTYISSTFGNAPDEYWQVIDKVALWPVMGERQVQVSGPDALRFVQMLTPRNLSQLTVGQCKYVLMTAPDGGILGDPILLRLEENKFWLSTADCDLELWAKGVAVNAGMDVRIADANVSVIQVQGPKSPSLMSALFGDLVQSLGYYKLMRAPFDDTELVISRTGFSGEFGYEIYLSDAAKGDALFEALMAAGKPFDVAPGCVSHARRIESGILSWGIDMTPAETPFEVGLGHLVDVDGPHEFIGKRALSALANVTTKRELVGLMVEGDALAPNEDVWPIYAGGIALGRLTSLVYSPRLEHNIALAIVAADQSSPGTRLDVDTWDGPRVASVCELPFMPKRQR